MKKLKLSPSLLKPIQNEDGFTLMGALILGAILLVLIIGFASYQYQYNKASQNKGNRSNFTQLESSIVTTTNQTDAVGQTEALQVAPLATPVPTP